MLIGWVQGKPLLSMFTIGVRCVHLQRQHSNSVGSVNYETKSTLASSPVLLLVKAK